MQLDRIPPETFVVYLGHHGDAAAKRADIILPGAAYTEKAGTYVNTAGRVQRAFRAVFAPGEAREDWRIIRAFSEVVGHTLPYDTLEELRAHMAQINPVFACGNTTVPSLVGEQERGATPASVRDGTLMATPLRPVVQDYYQTNTISLASQTMSECSRVYGKAPALAAESGQLHIFSTKPLLATSCLFYTSDAANTPRFVALRVPSLLYIAPSRSTA